MRVTFYGAATEVTGSMHLVECGGQRLLLDCGMFQGRRKESNQRNGSFPFDPKSIDAVVLSHAHIDHSGVLPALVKQGFSGPIYTTSATRSLCAVMLMDSAKIQDYDARWYNKKAPEWGVEPIEPIYNARDVLKCMDRFVSVNYDMRLPVGALSLTFRDAGHVLGSASVTLETKDGRRLIYSGDVGRPEAPLLRDPVPAHEADVLILESTYGNRSHTEYADGHEQLAEAIQKTVARKGKIIIPTFALERAQEVIFALKNLLERKQIPRIPVYVDSPLTCDITQIFRMHPEYFDTEVAQLYVKHDSPFYFPGLTYVRQVEDSKALNGRKEPMLIMSANGMCEAGRILHHLRNNIGDERNTIVFVGYQARHTLGRRIMDGDSTVRIFGRAHDVEAEVVSIGGLSGHADREGLTAWALPSRETCDNLFLVHGETEQSEPFAEHLTQAGFRGVQVAQRLQSVEIA